MHHPHAAELAIEGDAGIEIANVQRDMGKGRRHAASVPAWAARCIMIVDSMTADLLTPLSMQRDWQP